MALTTGANVAARPGRVGALGSIAVNADRARECGLVLQVDAFPASPENTAQAPTTGWPYVGPNPLGAPRQSRTTVYRLLARLIRRPSAKDPDHEYVANTAVDRHHRGRRYAPAGLIECLDAGGPVVPVAPGNTSATAARRERDRVNKPALVRSETSIGGVR